LILTLLGWLPGIIYAILVVNKHYADKNHQEMLQAIGQNRPGQA
jgi:hypothetical protein